MRKGLVVIGLALSFALLAAPTCHAQSKSNTKRETAKQEAARKEAEKKEAAKKQSEKKPAGARADEAQRQFDARMNEPAPAAATPAQPAAAPADANATPNLFQLWFRGGPLMYPITFISFLVVLLAVERWLGLRRGRVIPRRLVKGLGELAARPGGLDPRAAYQLCQQSPSPLANVLRSVLLKVGRPLAEVEHTVAEASEREAAKLYKNVRTLNLATSVAPLLGLLGTVQGMIECFFITAHLPVGADKSEYLANGIYIALVTTFGGLVVAIPAGVFAHYFEGRIQALFREIDELLIGFMPQLERFEGKLRMTRQGAAAAESVPRNVPVAEPVGKHQPTTG